jgi:hypothetical protein
MLKGVNVSELSEQCTNLKLMLQTRNIPLDSLQQYIFMDIDEENEGNITPAMLIDILQEKGFE